MAEEFKALLLEFRNGKITRREFFGRAIALTGSLAAVNALIGSLAQAATYTGEVAISDPACSRATSSFPAKPGRFSRTSRAQARRESSPRS